MKLYIQNHNQILSDVIKHFDIVDKIEDADRIVLWNDVGYIERGIINLAHAYKKKVIVIQHGRRGSSRYFPPFNEPLRGDKHLVWGSRDKQALVDAGHPSEKIKVVGTTLFSHLKSKEKHDGINIVFSPEHWDSEVQENRDTAYELRRLAKKNNWNIKTKIINGHAKELYDNPVYSDRNTDSHLEIVADVLKTADVVVGISESTFELFAQYLDIPVVIMKEWSPKSCNGDDGYKTYRRVISEASVQATIKTLGKEIQSQIENPRELADARMVVCAEEGGIGVGGLQKIIEEIKNV